MNRNSHTPPDRSEGNGPFISAEKRHYLGYPPGSEAHGQAHPDELIVEIPATTVVAGNLFKPTPRDEEDFLLSRNSSHRTDDILSGKAAWNDAQARDSSTRKTLEDEWDKTLKKASEGGVYFQNIPTAIIQNPILGAFAIQYPHIWKNIVLHWGTPHSLKRYLDNLEIVGERQKNETAPIEYSRQGLDPMYFTMISLVKKAHNL